MVDSKQRYLWRTLLMKYFTNKDYTNMNIAGVPLDKSNDPNEKELWMVAIKENAKYSVIHISLNQKQANIDYLEKMARMLSEAVDFNIYILNINLFDNENTLFTLGESICLYPEAKVDEKIIKEFDGIDKVLYISDNVDKDTDKELKEVRTLLQNKIRSYRKKTNNPVFGKLFVVCAIICVSLFLFIRVYSNQSGINTTSVAIAFGAYYKAFVSVLNQYWRFLTSGFIHVDFLHLLSNLIALFSIGRIVEKEFSSTKAFIILIVGIIMGNVFVFLGNNNIVALGLSGGITSLFGALVSCSIIKGYLKDRGFRNSLLINFVINVSISLLPNVSMLAHLGGLIVGGFLGVIFCVKTEKALRINTIIALVLSIGACGFFMSKRVNFDEYFLATDKQVLTIYEDFGIDTNKDFNKLINYYSKIGGK